MISRVGELYGTNQGGQWVQQGQRGVGLFEAEFGPGLLVEQVRVTGRVGPVGRDQGLQLGPAPVRRQEVGRLGECLVARLNLRVRLQRPP